MWSVYLAGNGELNYWKIGMSACPEKRSQSLLLPFEVRLVSVVPVGNRDEAREAEKIVQARFQHLQIRSEWFRDVVPAVFRAEAVAAIPQAKEQVKENQKRVSDVNSAYFARMQARRDQRWLKTQAFLNGGSK